MNLFVIGAIRSAGSVCWTVDEAVAALTGSPLLGRLFVFLIRFLTDNGYSMSVEMRQRCRMQGESRRLPFWRRSQPQLLVAGAAAATAPTAITGPVTAFGATTATLSGTVNPNGDATSWHFDYGTTIGYGSSTSSTNAGSGTNNRVTANVTGLTPGTTYHYRLVASSSSGTTQGADGIVTTAAVPAGRDRRGDERHHGSATLNGAVNPNGRPTDLLVRVGQDGELRLEDGR